MLLLKTVAQYLPPLALKVEPQLLLTLLVALLFLILFVIGVFAVWSRVRHLQLGGQSLKDHEWKEELLRKIAKEDEKSSSSA